MYRRVKKIPGIGHPDHPSTLWDLLSRQLVRISRSIPSFMMADQDTQFCLKRGNRG
jgi:hypothetical protein